MLMFLKYTNLVGVAVNSVPLVFFASREHIAIIFANAYNQSTNQSKQIYTGIAPCVASKSEARGPKNEPF